MGLIKKIKRALKLSYVDNNGYKQHYNPNSPDARPSGYAPVHRDVARQNAKADLSAGNCVHHKDGNKLNNNKRNLQIVSKKEHHAIHKAEGKEIWGRTYKRKR